MSFDNLTASPIIPGSAGLSLLVEDCEILSSSSYNNGGILIGLNSLSATRALVTRCEFVGNSGSYQAGALLCGSQGSTAAHEVQIDHCVFRGNNASLAKTIGVNVIFSGNPNLQLSLRNSVITEGSTAVRFGNGEHSIMNSNFCSGLGVINGPYTDLGGNVGTCPSDADCDSDGMNDFHQIVLGLADDLDGNWVIDACEELLVPSQYATIQAAIDAVGPGTFRVVAVAAGTYNETFALNGKDVTVRGAPNNATILDGTGLTTSIVRFTGGEPATASLEQLVFRNGTSGSLLNPKSTVRLGGAILAHDAFVNLLRCRFEYCSADFGGAAYLYSTTLHAQDCTFTNNNANDEGGAVLSFRTDGGVYSSSFTGNRCGTLSTSSGAAIKLVGGRTSDSIFAIEDCTITGAPVNGVGAAVQQFADSSGVPGVLHIINTSISGHTVDLGAAGLDVIGGMQSCVLSEGTVICNNTVRNVDGPFTIVSNATVCDCLSDMTGDDLVNGFDLSVVLSNWGLTPSSGDGDVNHDGMVDAADLAIALNTWGSCP